MDTITSSITSMMDTISSMTDTITSMSVSELYFQRDELSNERYWSRSNRIKRRCDVPIHQPDDPDPVILFRLQTFGWPWIRVNIYEDWGGRSESSFHLFDSGDVASVADYSEQCECDCVYVSAWAGCLRRSFQRTEVMLSCRIPLQFSYRMVDEFRGSQTLVHWELAAKYRRWFNCVVIYSRMKPRILATGYNPWRLFNPWWPFAETATPQTCGPVCEWWRDAPRRRLPIWKIPNQTN